VYRSMVLKGIETSAKDRKKGSKMPWNPENYK
jgi:hypothetical protein